MNTDLIFLIGFMGCGKTTAGKKLAATFELPFIDLDQRLEAQEGAIPSLIENHGEAYFRLRESELLKELKGEKGIVATGGGTPCYFDNLQWMKAHGTVVYLQATPAFLFSRLKQTDLSKRPLLKGLNDEQLISFIEKKLEERQPFYHQAHLIVDAAKPETFKNALHSLRHSDR
ncbi:MAG: shikimate kinase [Chitinophagales bacterium]